MKVVVDAFGADHPEKFIKGIAKAINEVDDISIVAVGDKEKIEEILSAESFDKSKLEIVHASEVVTNNESPVTAIRRKKDSSVVKSFEYLKENQDAVAMVSAGATGAVIVGASILLGRMEGVERPALTTTLPTVNGKLTCLVDCGANVDCRANHLVQFAKMASAYAQSLFGIKEPKIGLLSVGTEDEKGNALTKETFALLKQSELNFVGNVEGKTVLSGEVDVIVTDGFAGNVTVKTIESSTAFVLKIFTDLMKKHADKNSDFTFVKKALAEFMEVYDFNKIGGGVLLGVNKPVIKMHGSSNEDSVVAAVIQAKKLNAGEYLQKAVKNLK